jgi:hypothetical protein
MTVTRPAVASRRFADLALLSGAAPATVRLFGRPTATAAAAAAMGWRVVENGPADLGLCDTGSLADAVACRPAAIVMRGRVGLGALARHGYAARHVLAWPDNRDPAVVATLDPGPLRHLLGLAPASLSRRILGAGPYRAARHDLLPPHATLTIADREGRRSPWPFRAAGPAPGPDGWLVHRGRGDDLQRLVFLGFDAGHGRPGVAVKVGRVSGRMEPFAREERGLAMVAAVGGAVAAHAPALADRVEWHGLPMSVESAAAGRRLCDVLGGQQSHATRRRMVDAVAAWTVDVGRATRGPLDPATATRLEALASTAGRPGLSAGHLPGVLAHDDLGSWNIVVGPSGFTVVDWESAHRPGLALGDLAYFLADALTVLAGRRARRDPTAAMVRLFRGEEPLSPVLFDWIRRAAADVGLSGEDLGPVLTLTWLRHAASPGRRQQDLPASSAVPAGPAPHARLAAAWLADRDLGWGWDRWRP